MFLVRPLRRGETIPVRRSADPLLRRFSTLVRAPGTVTFRIALVTNPLEFLPAVSLMFLHKKSSSKPQVICSYCMKCGFRIGASMFEDALDALERDHECSLHQPDPPADLKPIRIRRAS